VSGATAVAAPADKATPPDPREAQARAQLDLGRRAIAEGEMLAAALRLREALRLQPDMVEAGSSLGLALYGLGDLDGAIEELRGLLGRHPEAVQARLTLATALIAKQDWKGARAELEEVVRQQPETLQALYSLGFVRYALGDLAGAIEAFRLVLAARPDHHDARYNLAVALKLAGRDAEATQEFLTAAQAGHGRAQFFVGTAYAAGSGVEPNLAVAIMWWSRAAAQGVQQADLSLGELRQTALGRGRRGAAERRAAEQAFRDYRAMLWAEFPDLARSGDDDTVGAALLRHGRGREAVSMLISEAASFSEPAQALLEAVYYRGVPGQVPAHDAQALRYFQTAADEGIVRARVSLARFYAAGLGVPQDRARAISLLKATPDGDAQRLLQELLAASPAPARP
jgi:TPR repeat protein